MAARTNARVNRRESFFERDPLTYRLAAPLLLPSASFFPRHPISALFSPAFVGVPRRGIRNSISCLP